MTLRRRNPLLFEKDGSLNPTWIFAGLYLLVGLVLIGVAAWLSVKLSSPVPVLAALRVYRAPLHRHAAHRRAAAEQGQGAGRVARRRRGDPRRWAARCISAVRPSLGTTPSRSITRPNVTSPAPIPSNFARSLAITLRFEGGRVDDKDDPGGRTNYGITQSTFWADCDARRVPRRDVFTITMAEVGAIYLTRYWNACGAAWLGWAMCLLVFDAAVNHGVARAKEFSDPRRHARALPRPPRGVLLCDRAQALPLSHEIPERVAGPGRYPA